MSSPFVAEIRIFGCNFAPTGWAQCNGQLLPISQNTALFSLLGTFYGGDGKSTFALPNLTDSAPIHVGGSQPGPGLSVYDLGQVGGTPNITLLTSEMPLHTHSMMASTQDGGDSHPQANLLAQGVGIGQYVEANSGSIVNLNQSVLPPAGGSLPHNNMMPFLVLNFCIALQGVFPPRS
jgi:microcystin-dependent protein